jgi:hypothetical protein
LMSKLGTEVTNALHTRLSGWGIRRTSSHLTG